MERPKDFNLIEFNQLLLDELLKVVPGDLVESHESPNENVPTQNQSLVSILSEEI